jgi:opacity protein-like surface antigen
MKNLICIIAFTTFYYSASAQLRANFMTGMANYKGDLQQKEITLQNSKHVYTIGASYNITGHLAVRAELSVTKLEGQDQDNTSKSLRYRNLSFKTNFTEAALMLEYDLFDLNNYKFTPYFFGGIGSFKFNPYTFDTLGAKLYLQPLSTEGQGLPQYSDRKEYKLSQFSIPFGAGVKYALSDYIWIGAEFGTRKCFTDYLDDVSKTYVDQNVLAMERGPIAAAYAYRGDEVKSNPSATYPADGVQRGNPLLNDNYYFGEVRLSIRLPWFEANNFDGRAGGRKRYACPRF